jgi:hypothetical protein
MRHRTSGRLPVWANAGAAMPAANPVTVPLAAKKFLRSM